MNRRGVARVAAGIALMLLGLLWMLQGADLVRVEPILCVTDCEPVIGGSPGWLIAGAVTASLGLAVTAAIWRRLRGGRGRDRRRPGVHE